jgi:hypothetical protein
MIFKVGDIYTERCTHTPYILLRIDWQDKNALSFKFIQEQGVGVQNQIALLSECGEVKKDSTGDIDSVDVQWGLFSQRFHPLIRPSLVCKHEWKETIGFTQIYIDCVKCHIKKEEAV